MGAHWGGELRLKGNGGGLGHCYFGCWIWRLRVIMRMEGDKEG